MDTSLFPVRCYTCGKVIGHLQIPYENLISQGVSPEDAMDQLGIKRFCCRTNALSPAVLPAGAFRVVEEQENELVKDLNRLSLADTVKVEKRNLREENIDNDAPPITDISREPTNVDFGTSTQVDFSAIPKKKIRIVRKTK